MKFLLTNILIVILSVLCGSEPTPNLILIVFIGLECPISQDYIITLNKIQTDYKNTLRVEGWVPGGATKKEIVKFQKEYRLEFPLARDKDNRIAKKWGATVTPEVILINTADKIIYRGAIDDWYYELGRHRSAPSQNFLRDAINATASGTKIKVTSTKPTGCFIEKK